MKKKVIVLILVLVIISSYFFIINSSLTKNLEFAQRINYCHNSGKVMISIDGNSIDLSDVSIEKNKKETTKFNTSGNFSFYKGVYGLDTYKFTIKKEISKLDKDLVLSFKKLNDNWWNVNFYKINLNISKNNNALVFKGKCSANDENFSFDKTIYNIKNNKYEFELF